MKYLLIFFILLVSQSIFSQDAATQTRIDSLNKIIANSSNFHDTVLAKTYLHLSEEYYVFNLDTVLAICNKVLEITDKGLNSKPVKEIARSFLSSKSGALNNMGTVYFSNGDIPKAIDYFHKSLKIDEQIGDKVGISIDLNNIGYLYQQYKDYEQALNYFNQALALKKEIGDEKGTATTLNNIGLVYFDQKDTVNALTFFHKSLVIEEKFGDKEGLTVSYSNIAAIYREQNKYNLAAEYYEKALQLDMELGDQASETTDLNNLGVIYFDQGELDEALLYAKRSLQLAKELGSPKKIMFVTALLTKIYEKQGKGMKALDMYRLKIEMRDSLNNSDVQNALTEQKLKFEFEKKESIANIQHEKELAINEAKENKNRIIIWSISIGLIIILVFAIIIGYRLKISTQQKRIIEQKNTENELLLGEIHHRVKNNLQVVSSLLSLQERNMTDKTAKAAILEGKERVQSMGLIHKLLYQENNFSGIQMNDYVEKLVTGLLDTFGKNKDDFELNFNFQKINLDVDTAVPIGLIINELVVNSLKYAYEKIKEPMLKVKLQEINKQLVLEVKDNGSGTILDIEKSKSFGMKLIKSLSRQLSGVIEIKQEKGLCFKITINDYKLLT